MFLAEFYQKHLGQSQQLGAFFPKTVGRQRRGKFVFAPFIA
jgi:hypothetical protein